MKNLIRNIIHKNEGSIIERIYKIGNDLQQLCDQRQIYNFYVKDEGGWIRVYYQLNRSNKIEWIDDLITLRKKKLERVLKWEKKIIL